MPKITFLPDNITVESPAGASLLEAARLAGVFVETPCGGKGSCQKCQIQIINSKYQISNNKEQTIKSNTPPVLICQTSIPNEDVTVVLPKTSGGKGQFEGFEDPSKYLSGRSESFLKAVKLRVTTPAPLDGLSDADRFSRAFLKAVNDEQAAAGSDQPAGKCEYMELPLNVLADLPEKLREAGGELLVFYYMDTDRANIVSIISNNIKNETTEYTELHGGKDDIKKDSVLLRGNNFSSSFFGIAVDIGTTTVALWLVDLESSKVLSAHNDYNSQVDCGLDVISRINYAKKFLPELRGRILKTVNELIARACKDSNIDPEMILCVSVAGNTTMIHLLLGIMPEYIRLAPYTPAVFLPQIYTAVQVGLSVCESAPVLFAPAVGSYVGGDITAGLLCTSLALNSPLPTPRSLLPTPHSQFTTPHSPFPINDLILFIDIGTNGEIVLGGSEFIFACACSAGPAFEGGGIKHGVRARAGAIERVVIKENGEPEIHTIGGAPPAGICGSGIISAIAEMFRKGIIDSAGKLVSPSGSGNREYTLHDNPQSKQKITISETDIVNFIRAKGAIFSACQTMLDSVGMSFGDVDRFYVAGGFGRFLDLEDARTIGLLPRLPDEKFTFLGNTSVTGAYLSLVSGENRTKVQELAGKITYVDLSSEPAYMDHYTGALFLPHTDRTLFE